MFKLNIPLATLVRVFVLAAFLVMAVQSSADAAGKSFVIENTTHINFPALYYAPNGGNWRQAPNGLPAYSTVGIPVNTNVRIWHFKIVAPSGKELNYSFNVVNRSYLKI